MRSVTSSALLLSDDTLAFDLALRTGLRSIDDPCEDNDVEDDGDRFRRFIGMVQLR